MIPKPSFKGPITQGTIRTSFVLGLRLVVQAGTLLLVARMLGPHRFGAFAGIAALAVILGTLSTFGSHLVLLGEVSKDPARRTRVLAYAVPLTLLCGSTLLFAYVVLSALLFNEAGIALAVLISIGTAEIVLQPLLMLPAMEHLAIGRIARSQLLQILPLGLRLAAAATVSLLGSHDPLILYGYGYFVASVVALGFALAALPGPWPRMRVWRLPYRTELKEATGYAAMAITAISPVELDKTLATRLLPLAAAGLYAAGARVVGAATLPIIAMMLSSLPRLFRDGTSQPQRTRHLVRWIFCAALGYSVALVLALWFLAPAFEWIFGNQYAGIQHTIRWFTLAVPGMALRLAAGSVLMALGKPWIRVVFEVLGLVTLVIAAVVLAPHFATAGMPLALACSEWVMAGIGWITLSRTQKHPKYSSQHGSQVNMARHMHETTKRSESGN